jgi:hypothetical protein
MMQLRVSTDVYVRFKGLCVVDVHRSLWQPRIVGSSLGPTPNLCTDINAYSTGSLGVLIGFFAVFEAILALFIAVAGGSMTRTHFEIKIHFLDPDGS